MKEGLGSAPGKVILTGEHSVVYGKPAIAASLGLRCSVKSKKQDEEGIIIHSIDLEETIYYNKSDLDKLRQQTNNYAQFDNIALASILTLDNLRKPYSLFLEIHSNIPISSGLGSSAAVVVASIASILDLFDATFSLEEISEIAFNAEKITHGNPSGIDNSIATFGGVLKFENGTIEMKQLNSSIPILIGNTTIPRNTRALVSQVARLRESYKTSMDLILDAMGMIATRVEIAIEEGNLNELGNLFNMNQGLLDSIGVGNRVLSEYIWHARDVGALGAKLTGAGGGGCMIILTNNESKDKIIAKLQEKNLNIISTELSKDGVKIGS